LATDNISPAFLASQPAHNVVEYEALLMMEPEIKVSVDWKNFTKGDVDVAAISVSPIRGGHMVVSVDQNPFFLDTGATMHISPE
jgi:hypothetical protein